MNILRRGVVCVSAAILLTSIGSAVSSHAAVTGPVISIGSAGVVEGDSHARLARFTITVSPPAVADIRVRVATNNVTADSDDYQPKAVTLRIRAGRPSAVFAVRVFGDIEDEADETFAVRLSQPVGATIGRNPGIGTIYTDDIAPLPAPVITNVQESGGPDGSLRPQLSGTSLAGTSVEFFDDNACTGTPWAFASAEEFATGNLTIGRLLTYGDHQLYARASGTMFGVASQSECSAPFAYTAVVRVSSIQTDPNGDSSFVISNSTPHISGLAPAGSTVAVFSGADCSGTPLWSGSAEDFGAGVTISVPPYTVTQLRVSAALNGLSSGCVIGPIYEELTPRPETEPNDTVEAANLLPSAAGYPSTLAIAVASGVAGSGDADVFRFDLPAGPAHTVHAVLGDLAIDAGGGCTNASEYTIEVLDAGGAVIGTGATGGYYFSQCAEITLSAVAGDHVFVRVSDPGFLAFQYHNPYTLVVTAQ